MIRQVVDYVNCETDEIITITTLLGSKIVTITIHLAR